MIIVIKIFFVLPIRYRIKQVPFIANTEYRKMLPLLNSYAELMSNFDKEIKACVIPHKEHSL